MRISVELMIYIYIYNISLYLPDYDGGGGGLGVSERILDLASGETFVASGNQFGPRKTEIDPNARNFVYIYTSNGVYIYYSIAYTIYIRADTIQYIYIYIYSYWPRPKRVIIRIALLVGKTLTTHDYRTIVNIALL